jgi:hypothetical protein
LKETCQHFMFNIFISLFFLFEADRKGRRSSAPLSIFNAAKDGQITEVNVMFPGLARQPTPLWRTIHVWIGKSHKTCEQRTRACD